MGGWGSGSGSELGSPGTARPRIRERGSVEAGVEVATGSAGTAEGEGTPGAWDEEGGDKTQDGDGIKGEGRRGGVAGGGGGVGQATPMGVELCEMVTGDGAVNMGGPLADGDGGFWVRGDGAVIGTSGRGPATFSGGLLIMMGGEGCKGVKLHADHTTDLGGERGEWVGAEGEGGGGCCSLLGTVA